MPALQHLFKSYFIGGFECSTHRLKSGKRLDLVSATRHDEFVQQDYARLAAYNMHTAREGLRWHLIETRPGHYDFSTVEPILAAARANKVQVIWDLLHFGWPDDIDVFSARFVERFAAFARAVARHLVEQGCAPLHICPVNEISFLSWIGGEAGDINPYARGRGYDLKCQLVRGVIAAIEAVREVDPGARFHHIEPVFNVIAQPHRPQDAQAAETYRQYQFQGWDLIAGRENPALGGREDYLDVIGMNYYPWNQWYYDGPLHGGATLDMDHPRYRPFSEMAREIWTRYGKPLYLAETGRENERRPAWLAYIGGEVRKALAMGVPIEGVCLYPVVNFPGWENERHCHNGMWDYADDRGERELYLPMAEELLRQQAACAEALHTIAFADDAPREQERALRTLLRSAGEAGSEGILQPVAVRLAAGGATP